jgi:DNA-binding ferritin-like protein (Dps family)
MCEELDEMEEMSGCCSRCGGVLDGRSPAQRAADNLGPISERGNDWLNFSDKMFNHIENYTVKQYGDKGNDQITHWEIGDCIKQIEKYFRRFGSNQRSGQDLLDLMKIAHYAQMAFDKMETAAHDNNDVVGIDVEAMRDSFVKAVESMKEAMDKIGVSINNLRKG